MRGITHFAWEWSGGARLGYLCCMDAEMLETYDMPTPQLNVTCVACIGTIV